MTSRHIFLLLTVAVVAVLGIVDINFYPLLSQGDHGRDLYAAQEALRGKLPYKDYWWVYGPLMPYYYALFYKFFGGSIASFLLGKLVLKIACAAFFYLGAAVMMAPSVAFLAAMWFTQGQQDFFFTFNHIGGIAAQLGVLYLLFAYIRRPDMRYLWPIIPAVFIYGLIKINFGLAALAAAVMTVALVDFVRKIPFSAEKKKFYLLMLVAVPAGLALIYGLLFKGLPLYVIRQCMPYFGDDQPYHRSPMEVIPYFFMQHWMTFVHSPIQTAVGIILHGATLTAIALLVTGRLDVEKRRTLLLALAGLGIFFIVNFHEFIVSGVWYRTFWSLPFLFMFHFLMMSTAFAFLPALARRLLWGLFGALLLLGFTASTMSTLQAKVPPRFLDGPHGQVYLGNEPQWTQTVGLVSAFVDKTLKPGELFFALPYDCIYYYLADRESPTRQLIFFDHIKIPPQQEAQIIGELESKKVNYVLMSNRIMSPETGLGTFGKTYCPLLARYIGENFTLIGRQGGDWQNPPGWGNNHGVLIFKRK